MDLKHFFKNAKERELDRNEVLHKPGEECTALGYILSGKLLMKKYLTTGKELLLTEFCSGEMFGELLMLAGESYRGWLIADEPTVVLELSIGYFDELLNDPAFKQLFFHRIFERVSRMTERIEILSYKKISDRIILFFLHHYNAGKEYEIHITDLAEELNCSREALSRAISSLEKNGAVVRVSGKITIVDQAYLENQLSDYRLL